MDQAAHNRIVSFVRGKEPSVPEPVEAIVTETKEAIEPEETNNANSR